MRLGYRGAGRRCVIWLAVAMRHVDLFHCLLESVQYYLIYGQSPRAPASVLVQGRLVTMPNITPWPA